MDKIDKVVFGLAKLFPDIEFDVDIEHLDNTWKYKVWVSDCKFYLEDELFKKICKAFKNKYPDTKWFAYHSGKRPD